MICKCDVVVFYLKFEVYDFKNRVCGSKYAMVCMDMDYFVLLIKNIY